MAIAQRGDISTQGSQRIGGEDALDLLGGRNVCIVGDDSTRKLAVQLVCLLVRTPLSASDAIGLMQNPIKRIAVGRANITFVFSPRLLLLDASRSSSDLRAACPGSRTTVVILGIGALHDALPAYPIEVLDDHAQQIDRAFRKFAIAFPRALLFFKPTTVVPQTPSISVAIAHAMSVITQMFAGQISRNIDSMGAEETPWEVGRLAWRGAVLRVTFGSVV